MTSRDTAAAKQNSRAKQIGKHFINFTGKIDRMKLKETFSTIAHQYDQSRVDYPPTVFRDIIKYVKLTKKDPILEIGIGTGKATYPFARLKNPILANDISPALVKVAKLKLKKYPNVKYIIGQFENINLPKNNFKLIFSGNFIIIQ